MERTSLWLVERFQPDRKGRRRFLGFYAYWKERLPGGAWRLRTKSLRTKSRTAANKLLADLETKLVGEAENADKKARTIEEARDEFIDVVLPALVKANERSPRTISKYRIGIEHFLRYLKMHNPEIQYLDQLKKPNLSDFRIAKLNEGKLSPSTVSGTMRSLSAFFTWALEKEYIKEDLMQNVELGKISNRIEIFQQHEIPLMLDESKKVSDSLYGTIITFLQTGLRKEELIYAQWVDLNDDRKVLKIRAKLIGENKYWRPKNGKEREVFLPELAYKAICKLPRVEEYIFLNRHGRIWIKVDRDLKRFFEQIKIGGNAHRFRHTYASYSLACGIPLQTLRTRLGHASLETTDKYSHVIDFKLDAKTKKIFSDWGN